MKASFAGLLIASGGREGTNGARWNGTQVNDEAQFLRAAANTFFPRGNRSTTFAFSVTRGFDTEAEALAFAALHVNSLPQSGDLAVFDEEATFAVTLAAAVLDTLAIEKVVGTAVVVSYQFKGGAFASTDVPDIVEGDILKKGSVDLDVNDESKAVSFGAAFASAPDVVNCWVVPPDAAAPVKFIQAAPQGDSITASGFTALIGFPIPATGYKLKWEAYTP